MRPRAGVKDEQRCENVTTNSLCSPNVTSPLSSSPLPSSGSAPVHPLSNLHLFSSFLSICSPSSLPSSLSRTLIFISLIGRLWEQIFLNSSAPVIHGLLPMTLDLSSTIKNPRTNFPTQKFPTGTPVWVSLDIRADVSSVLYNFLLAKWVCKFM